MSVTHGLAVLGHSGLAPCPRCTQRRGLAGLQASGTRCGAGCLLLHGLAGTRGCVLSHTSPIVCVAVSNAINEALLIFCRHFLYPVPEILIYKSG